MILKPVCVKCQCFYRPEHNGHFFTEMMPTGEQRVDLDNIDEAIRTEEDRRGTKAPHLWQPYKLWVGDLWKCPDCAHEIVVGVIGGPVAERHTPHFDSLIERYGGNQLKVNDC